MRTQNAAIGMHFVHHNIGQRGEKLGPLLVVRQKRKVQHFGIGDEHGGRCVADFSAEMRGGVAVINGGRGASAASLHGLWPCVHKALEGRELVLCESL